jgi:hypothetical protein
MAPKLKKTRTTATTADFIREEVDRLEKMADECPNCTEEAYCQEHDVTAVALARPKHEWN